ncbi:unnamed protein product [Closterium sp. Naga37s-1]|nr:unnamed protein product [Closterium sp. Naga37s-1]
MESSTLQLLDSTDAVVRLRHVLATQLQHGWMDLAAARYSHASSPLGDGGLMHLVGCATAHRTSPGTRSAAGVSHGKPLPLAGLAHPTLRSAQSRFALALAVAVEVASLQQQVARLGKQDQQEPKELQQQQQQQKPDVIKSTGALPDAEEAAHFSWPTVLACLFAAGFTLGPPLDGIHSVVGLQVYDVNGGLIIGGPDGLYTSVWVFPLLGAMYAVVGALQLLVDQSAFNSGSQRLDSSPALGVSSSHTAASPREELQPGPASSTSSSSSSSSSSSTSSSSTSWFSLASSPPRGSWLRLLSCMGLLHFSSHLFEAHAIPSTVIALSIHPAYHSFPGPFPSYIPLLHPSPPLSVLISLLHFSSQLFKGHAIPSTGIFAILALCAHANWFAFDRTLPGYLLALFVAVGAPASEVLIMKYLGLWHYTEPDIFIAGEVRHLGWPLGLVSWTACCYFVYTQWVPTVARTFAASLSHTTSHRFVPVCLLLSCYPPSSPPDQGLVSWTACCYFVYTQWVAPAPSPPPHTVSCLPLCLLLFTCHPSSPPLSPPGPCLLDYLLLFPLHPMGGHCGSCFPPPHTALYLPASLCTPQYRALSHGLPGATSSIPSGWQLWLAPLLPHCLPTALRWTS